MEACNALQVFEKPLPLESHPPWKNIKSMITVDHYSFTEIFGQLYLKENNHVLDSLESSPSSSPFPSSSLSSSLTSMSAFPTDENGIHLEKQQHRRDSISSMNSESSSTCTEELGFESSDDADQDSLKNDSNNINDWQPQEDRTRTKYENSLCESRRYSRRNMGAFPPPISCIGRNGRPWVCFKSVREDGRFILTGIRIPTQEFLHACRKNGRLKMQFVQSDDEFFDDDDEEDEEEKENAEEYDEGTSEIEDGDTQVTGV